MNKKIFGGIAIVAIAVAVAFNVTISNQKQDTTSMLALANVEALADGGEGGDGEILQRIKTWKSCYNDKTGMFTGFSITECEDYTWVIPMVRTTCVLTNCSYGSH